MKSKEWFALSLVLFLLPVQGWALTVMEINAEWLWDSQQPHDGRIVGKKESAPTLAQYEKELQYYAGLIRENHGEVVGLIELEGCHVAQDLAKRVGARWESICKKGRDTFTGQDVALLFDTGTFAPQQQTKTTFPKHYSMQGKKKVRPSKVLSVVARHRSSGENYLVTVVHLISKTNPKNEAKRHAQALAVRSGIENMSARYKVAHHVLMGDMNDYPGSQTLQVLKSGNLINPADSSDCSYVYRGKCNLIDHILLSKNISGGELVAVDVPKNFSDHKALIYRK